MSVYMDRPSTYGTIKPRLSQVCVEIPTSPFLARFHQLNIKNLKENASPKVPLASSSSKMPLLKRKHEESHTSSFQKLKQPKTASIDIEKTDAPCHHCRKRKPLTDIVQCTRLKGGSRCRASYCDICLHKRYGLHLDTFKEKSPKEPEQKHVPEGYIFSCPRCNGCCTCAPCRKKGTVDIPNTRHTVENHDTSGSKSRTNTSTTVRHAPKPKPSRKKPLVPEPFWVPLPIQLSREDFEDRLYMREFIIRFNPILNIGVKNLDELDDPTALHDPSSKAILLALLDIVAVEEESNVKEIQRRLKVLQGLGLNWSKIIPVVEDLRSLVPSNHPFHTLPAIEKTKDTLSSYNMRGARFHGIDADNLMPMLLHLIDHVCNGESVREELEVGGEQVRKARSEYYTALKNENDKWNELKQTLMATKPNIDKRDLNPQDHKWTNQASNYYQEAEAQYKVKINDLRNYFRLECNAGVPRFEPLGTDTDGRIYYLPSSLGPFRGKKDRLPSPSERSNFKKWSWFIAVYGRPGTQIRDVESNELDSNSNMDIHKESWWGFAEVDEIRKLSRWLASRVTEKENTDVAAIGETASKAVTNDMKSLAKDIAEFADFIDWRLKRSTS